MIDSHCHLDDSKFESDRNETIDRAREAGVERILTIGTGDGPPNLQASIRIAEKHSSILAAVGIHPEHAAKAESKDFETLASLLRHPKVVALGEIGLDYHWEPFDKARQKIVFLRQMELAKDAGKPILIHTRDAWEDTIELLREHWSASGLPCVMHCFSGGPEEAEQAVSLGFYLSFAGIVTYPNATNVQAAVTAVPSDRLLVETDAPWLPPVPYRGKRNEPAFVTHTANKVAELRGEEPAELSLRLQSNFDAIFGSV